MNLGAINSIMIGEEITFKASVEKSFEKWCYGQVLIAAFGLKQD